VGIAAVVILPAAITGALVSYEGREGEPFAFLTGVSIWPTEWLRLMVVMLVGVFFLHACRLRRENDYALTQRYQLFGEAGRESDTSVARLWTFYLEQHREGRLWKYALLASLLFVGLVGLSLYFFNLLHGGLPGGFELFYPRSIYRGEFAYKAGMVIFLFTGFAFACLLFYSLEMAIVCRTFVTELSDKPADWPQPTLERVAERRGLSNCEDAGEWLAIQLIAERTRVIETLLAYPFFVIFLLAVIHSPLFDRWPWLPWFLLLLLTTAIPVMGIFGLKNAAHKARQQALDRTRQRLSQARGEQDSARAEQLQLLMEEIQTNHEGAFRPLGQQLRLILLPFGAAGGAALLEYLLRVS
jgi:hypothetical protein